jgi:fructokinase
MIVVCGEALMDVFTGEPTNTGLTLDARMGGSPFNVALGLARLQQPVSYFGSISTGPMGDRLISGLQLEGVNVEAVVRKDAPTTVSMVEINAEGVPTYAFHGINAADRLLTQESLTRLPEAQAYHFGSYAMVVEPVGSTLKAAALRERGRALVSYDPNIRLNVEPDIERWRRVLIGMLGCTDLLKISAEDLEHLAPGLDPHVAAREWLDEGIAMVVVTRGREGALAWTPNHHVVSHARPTKVLDTVGAGDSFQAALLTALSERNSLDASSLRKLSASGLSEVMAFAATAASITCSRRGADLPRRSEVINTGGGGSLRGLVAA